MFPLNLHINGMAHTSAQPNGAHSQNEPSTSLTYNRVSAISMRIATEYKRSEGTLRERVFERFLLDTEAYGEPLGFRVDSRYIPKQREMAPLVSPKKLGCQGKERLAGKPISNAAGKSREEFNTCR